MRIGANYLGEGRCEFVVWAPLLKDIQLKTISPEEKMVRMEKDSSGYWKAMVEDVFPGALYMYRLNDEKERPDPASRYQPEGVHKPSQVIDQNAFRWDDNCWRGIDISEMIIYELHVGTFSPEGTFDAIVKRLDELKDTGINAIEIMPVAQFPGERNWGYDGVYPFAVQNSYGGPEELKILVNECHKKGIAVVLDVVYNHLGPEGNYLWDYGPYFTNKYKTPWGDAINFDGPFSDGVRNYFIQNAIYWFRNYHVDALRLDAIHAIVDMSARHILEELAEETKVFSKKEGRKFYLIAESNLNDARVIRPKELGGYSIDAQWCDDFHHSVRTLITGDKSGYFIDFGEIEHLVKSFREGFVYSGQYSEYRKRRHGNSSKDRPCSQFVVSSQNHDQIGNRMLGERPSTIVSFESLKLAAGVVLFSPYIPLLFMGEEYGDPSPFLYFVSHSDPSLIESVREGRKEEFESFRWKGEPPDPQSMETFLRSKMKWEKKSEGDHQVLYHFYKNLIKLRRLTPAFLNLDKDCLDVSGFEEEKVLFLRRWKDNSHVLCLFNFNAEDIKIRTHLAPSMTSEVGRSDPQRRPASESQSKRPSAETRIGKAEIREWKKILDSSDEIWNGPGSLLSETISSGEEITMKGHSFATFTRMLAE